MMSTDIDELELVNDVQPENTGNYVAVRLPLNNSQTGIMSSVDNIQHTKNTIIGYCIRHHIYPVFLADFEPHGLAHERYYIDPDHVHSYRIKNGVTTRALYNQIGIGIVRNEPDENPEVTTNEHVEYVYLDLLTSYSTDANGNSVRSNIVKTILLNALNAYYA